MSKRVNYSLLNGTTGNFGIGTTSPDYALHVVGDIFASGDVTCSSDIRLKSNIQKLELSKEQMNKIDNLRGVTFTRDTETDNIKHIGFIAQEIEEVFPELVSTDKNNGLKSIAYGNITAVLLEYIKELKNEINNLNHKVDELNKKINN
jgi:hypothetical protein